MNNKKNNLNEELLLIINKYDKIRNILFPSWIYIIIIIVSILFFWFVDFDVNADYMSVKYDNMWWKVDWYSMTWSVFEANNLYIWNDVVDLEVENLNTTLIWWTLEVWDNKINSNSNIINLSWFVFPFNFELDKAYLSSLPVPLYTESWKKKEFIGYLEKILYDDISLDYNKINKPDIIWIKNDVISDFGLKCLNSSKLLNYLCNKNVENFLTNMHLYDFSWYESDLSAIFNNVWDKYKADFCKWINNSIKYQSRNIDYFDNMVNQCDDGLISDLKFSQEYYVFLSELNSVLWTRVYKNNKLNNLKIIIFQRKILLNKTSISLINNYLSFLEELLKKQNLDKMYSKIVFYFNEKYLKNIISDDIKKNPSIMATSKDSVLSIENKISNVSRWDNLVWYEWIRDDEILTIVSWDKGHWAWTDEQINKQTIVSKYDDFLLELSNYIETKRKRSWEKKFTSLWKLTVSYNVDDKVSKKDFDVQVLFYNDYWYDFKIENIKINDNYINQGVNKYMKNLEYISIWDLSEYIAVLIKSEWQDTTYNICYWLREFVSSEDGLKIKDCQDDYISIEYENDYINLSLESNTLISFETNNKNLEKKLSDMSSNKDISDQKVINFISVWYEELVKLNDDSMGLDRQEILSLRSRFKDYLWSEVSINRVIKEWFFMLSFSVNGHEFEWTFDTNMNYRLSRLQIISESDTYRIPWFSVDMVANNRTDFNRFKVDPIEFLKEIDQDSINSYLEDIQEN